MFIGALICYGGGRSGNRKNQANKIGVKLDMPIILTSKERTTGRISTVTKIRHSKYGS